MAYAKTWPVLTFGFKIGLVSNFGLAPNLASSKAFLLDQILKKIVFIFLDLEIENSMVFFNV